MTNPFTEPAPRYPEPRPAMSPLIAEAQRLCELAPQVAELWTAATGHDLSPLELAARTAAVYAQHRGESR